ncbi:hypothetical protein D3W54_06745 [Komagataeibacter medellinensis]|uniref:Glycosyltransferase n=1 Tax=Komagataeibacter medellinensis TaxID=1177712 RepID=A0ABQ6VUR2_9PROT|nr:glycosyltransferase [Komagataeibacter medellinensis]KAB8123949.1 hypothetical protein D3W54_06745 [Komagataeibacter medellinensis]
MSVFHEIKYIHQILILSDGKIPKKIPDFIEKNIKKIRLIYNNCSYKIWSGEEIRALIKNNMPRDVLKAYDDLKPFAYKADLARYVLLYLYGGLYIDIGINIQTKWNIPKNYGIAACRDVSFVTPAWIAIQNGLLWAVPERIEFLNAINYIVLNCNNKFYGINPLYPTGPVLLGRAFVSTLLKEEVGNEGKYQYVGECKPTTPDNDMKNVAYISKSGDVIAFRNKILPGDISHLGIKNGNNYNFMWYSKTVYGETQSNSVVASWSASGPEIRATFNAVQDQNGIHAKNHVKGRISYGPYIKLPAGRYYVKLYFSPDVHFFSISLEVSYGTENRILCKVKKYKFHMSRDNSVIFPIKIPYFMENIEFRLRVGKHFSGSIMSYELIKK